jgi:hypothetical protein
MEFIEGKTISIDGSEELISVADININTDEIENPFKYIYEKLIHI